MKKQITACAAMIGLAASTYALNLADLPDSTTILDGTTLTGTLSYNYKICIEEGATVTLSNVTISRPSSSSCKWAGLTCLGDATLILEGDNLVKGFYDCGMYDYQVVEDVNIANGFFANGLPGRSRPWHG